MSIKNEIKEKIKLALNKLNIEEENIIIEIPKDKTKGDYSTNKLKNIRNTVESTITNYASIMTKH